MVQGRGRRVLGTLERKEGGDRRLCVVAERIVPPELEQRGVERLATVHSHGVLQAPLEEDEVAGVHHRSAPRSRSRRAMMFLWISAVPP